MARPFIGYREQPHFTCPDCGMTSYNPNDIEHQYCGNCHRFTGLVSPEEKRKLRPHGDGL